MGNWLKTLALTVDCPYCRTGYVFRKPELLKAWRDSGSCKPLHAGCIQQKKIGDKAKTV